MYSAWAEWPSSPRTRAILWHHLAFCPRRLLFPYPPSPHHHLCRPSGVGPSRHAACLFLIPNQLRVCSLIQDTRLLLSSSVMPNINPPLAFWAELSFLEKCAGKRQISVPQGIVGSMGLLYNFLFVGTGWVTVIIYGCFPNASQTIFSSDFFLVWVFTEYLSDITTPIFLHFITDSKGLLYIVGFWLFYICFDVSLCRSSDGSRGVSSGIGKKTQILTLKFRKLDCLR